VAVNTLSDSPNLWVLLTQKFYVHIEPFKFSLIVKDNGVVGYRLTYKSVFDSSYLWVFVGDVVHSGLGYLGANAHNNLIEVWLIVFHKPVLDFALSNLAWVD
jgi:hypothetical protein